MLDQLKKFRGRRTKKRLGRGDGSGWGHTAGKGHKGAKARSGYSTQAQFEGGQMPISRRFPKRGFTNIFKTTFQVVNVGNLADKYSEGDVVDFESLLANRLIRKTNLPVKILGNGEITTNLTVRAHAFSQSAIQKITQAGGQTEEV